MKHLYNPATAKKAGKKGGDATAKKLGSAHFRNLALRMHKLRKSRQKLASK